MSAAKPMSPFARLDAYLNGPRRAASHLTPAQRRRISHKSNRAHRAERQAESGRELTPRQARAARVRAAFVARRAAR